LVGKAVLSFGEKAQTRDVNAAASVVVDKVSSLSPMKFPDLNLQTPCELANMKRKLDSHDVPMPVTNAQDDAKGHSFESLGLDSRILQAIAQQGFSTPTLVQIKAIPPALEGRNVMAQSKTGSGKTAAYLLPILNSILKRKQVRTELGS
jgi:hypothetical protein